jgi:hypothetical protein
LLDVALYDAPAKVPCPGQVSVVPLAFLADVHKGDALASVELGLNGPEIHLFDSCFGFMDQFQKAWRMFHRNLASLGFGRA